MQYLIIYYNELNELCIRYLDTQEDVKLWLSIYYHKYKDIKIVKGSLVTLNVQTETTFTLEE